MRKYILMGVKEAALLLKLSPERVKELWYEHPKFPEPIDVLLNGPVWWAEDIEEFAKIPRPVGRPKKVKT